jgi:3-oxoacyl-[acyl-carrier protein] reductase
MSSVTNSVKSVTDRSSTRQLRLRDKVAAIFGASGEVGAAVATEFAAQGARIFLSGRTRSHVQTAADGISRAGGTAAVAEVNALDEDAVNNYLDNVVAEAGKIDIAFNAMGPQAAAYRNATSTMELPLETFMLPITQILASQFITARSAAKHMIEQRSGVIVFLTATPSKGVAPNTSAIGAAYGAVESLVRCLAVDLSPFGIRAVCVRSMIMADTRIMDQTFEMGAKAMKIPKAKMADIVTGRALLHRAPSIVETARIVAFLASDDANSLTGAIINSSCGQVLD